MLSANDSAAAFVAATLLREAKEIMDERAVVEPVYNSPFCYRPMMPI